MVFFFPCAANRAWGVGQCSPGNETGRLCCLREIKEEEDVKPDNWAADPFGSLAGFDVCKAKIPYFDDMCTCHLVLNQSLHPEYTWALFYSVSIFTTGAFKIKINLKKTKNPGLQPNGTLRAPYLLLSTEMKHWWPRTDSIHITVSLSDWCHPHYYLSLSGINILFKFNKIRDLGEFSPCRVQRLSSLSSCFISNSKWLSW